MEFIKELLFPKFCVSCQMEGNYLCQDCFSLLDFPTYTPEKVNNIAGLFWALPYNNFIVKKLIAQFKYQPIVKDLAAPLASLIIHYIKLNEKQMFFSNKDFILPIPLTKKRLKERGFNQSEEIAKELSKFFGIPLVNNVLLKIKETLPQVELSGRERESNVRNAFSVINKDLIRDKKIFLVDDVYTTGSTMAEAARVLKEAGAKQVWGIAVARE